MKLIITTEDMVTVEQATELSKACDKIFDTDTAIALNRSLGTSIIVISD